MRMEHLIGNTISRNASRLCHIINSDSNLKLWRYLILYAVLLMLFSLGIMYSLCEIVGCLALV